MSASEIELPDGTKVPIKIPPGMPTEQAQALVAYLQANPEAAKQFHLQAQQMLKTPGLAQAFINMQASMTLENRERFSILKDDPDLKGIFEEVSKSGPDAFQKYWNDDELMSKISAKLRQADAERAAANGEQAAAAKAAKPTAGSLGSLHEAAKFGDVESAKRLKEEGKDVNEKNEKNVSPLGIAVGFNRVEMVRWLLDNGADVEQRDGSGNTALHYAAGYGRKDCAELLIAAGARMDCENDNKQKAIDVAKMNREKSMVDFLRAKRNEALEAADEAAEAAKKAAVGSA